MAPPFGVRARKLATLSMSTGRIMFRSPSELATYDAVAVAKCGKPTTTGIVVDQRGTRQLWRSFERFGIGLGHRPPQPGCTCGFHGTLGEVETPRADQVVLEVDLVGGLVAHGDLRRSERQRVLGIAIPKACAAEAAQPSLNGGAATRGRCGATATGLRATPDLIIPVCEKHAHGALLSVATVGERADVAAFWMDEAVPLPDEAVPLSARSPVPERGGVTVR